MTFRLKGASGDLTGRRFDLSPDTLLGSGGEADIRLDGLLDRHARIVLQEGRLRLECPDRCWVNGLPATRTELQSGDEIRIGEHRFVLQAPGLKPARVLDDAPTHRSRVLLWVLAAGVVAAAAAVAWWWISASPGN